MTYIQKHVDIRRHPDALLEGVRSVVMVCLVYGEDVPQSIQPGLWKNRAVRPGPRLSSGPLGQARGAAGLAAQRNAQESMAGPSLIRPP